MIAPAAAERDAAGSRPPSRAARARSASSPLLFAVAAVGLVVDRRPDAGMDDGPWTGLGTLGWFLGVWVVMMAAMMFPSVAPTVALYSRMTRQRSRALAGRLRGRATCSRGPRPAWSPSRSRAPAEPIAGDVLAWDRAGRWVAGATLLVAAAYELTPLKDVCLGKCRSPLGFLLGSWRDGTVGALRMGAKNGAWCVGCCWALMASLFALGVMSIAVDGVRRRADRRREAAPLAPRRGLRDGGGPARARACSCSSRPTPFPA